MHYKSFCRSDDDLGTGDENLFFDDIIITIITIVLV